MNYYDIPIKTVVDNLNSDINQGLSNKQAEEKLKKYGKNKLEGKKKKSFISKFFEQFKDIMIIILIIAAIISFVVAIIEKDSSELFEPVLILIIVILNALIGVLQENKSEKALEALQKMSVAHARVIRDGKEMILSSEDLVPGDIILLEAGDVVPADARIIECSALKCDESALTGESIASEKIAVEKLDSQTAIGDRVNMLYSSSNVSNGLAKAIVTATANDTEMGKIANMLNNQEKQITPLQRRLADLGKYLGIAALIACAVIFVIGILNKMPILHIFMISISLAVSAIPEGLPAIISVVLSLGVWKMANNNAIVKSLPAVETLGSASIICSDKTGTLTQNKMTLVKAYSNQTDKFEEISANNSWSVRKMLNFASLCTSSNIEYKDGEYTHIGDTTETALLVAAHKNGSNKADLLRKYPKLGEIPFDSDRKLMTSIHNIDGSIYVIVKGALDSLIDRCKGVDVEKIRSAEKIMSDDSLRVLAIAYKEIDSLPEKLDADQLEKDLYLLGLVGMIDPPREEAKIAVAECRNAGIKPIMITGDHVQTAVAIAKSLDIYRQGDMALLGVELDKLSDEELDKILTKVSVYARVSPQNKIRIVKAWQRLGKVVSMTGDGVNDAPALKAADIGCAMGITGTEVSKGAADIILSDDNFATIVKAVKEGRGIYDNIKKVVGFLLGTNIGEILTIFIAMLLWHESPLVSMQLLWINLITDGLPAIALGVEAIEKDVMKRDPKPQSEGIFAHGYALRIVLQGCFFALISLISYYIGKHTSMDIKAAQTMTFITLSLSQVVQAFNMRSLKSLFKIGPFSNKQLNKAAIVSLIMIFGVVFTPWNTLFGLTKLNTMQYLIAFGLAISTFVVMEIAKLIEHKIGIK